MNDLRASALGDSVVAGERFKFGDNWRSFLGDFNEVRLAEAKKSLQWLTGRDRLDSLHFLDIGSGSGLSSLAARRLGARVVSFDYDPQSVECTAMLRDRFFPNDPHWRVENGSILDCNYLGTLGKFDIVYSWGVLHHTGAMREAIESASQLVAPNGLLVLALYRKTLLCWFWALEKRWYCKSSSRIQAIARRIYLALMRLAFMLSVRDFTAYVAGYCSNRGMNFFRDVEDWLGGYPYESATPAEVAQAMGNLGFEEVRSNIRPASMGIFGSGCDEYVYRQRRSGTMSS